MKVNWTKQDMSKVLSDVKACWEYLGIDESIRSIRFEQDSPHVALITVLEGYHVASWFRPTLVCGQWVVGEGILEGCMESEYREIGDLDEYLEDKKVLESRGYIYLEA